MGNSARPPMLKLRCGIVIGAAMAAGLTTAATCIVDGDPIAASAAHTSVMASASAPLVTGTHSLAGKGVALRSDKAIATAIVLR